MKDEKKKRFRTHTNELKLGIGQSLRERRILVKEWVLNRERREIDHDI